MRVGSCLADTDEHNTEHAVTCDSQKLVCSEYHWKEACAVVWALKRFRPIIFGLHWPQSTVSIEIFGWMCSKKRKANTLIPCNTRIWCHHSLGYRSISKWYSWRFVPYSLEWLKCNPRFICITMSVHINDFHCFQFAARLLQVRAGMNQDFYAGVIHMSYNGSRLFMFCCITCFHWINIILWFSVYYCSVDVLRFSGQWTLLIWILVFQSSRWHTG